MIYVKAKFQTTTVYFLNIMRKKSSQIRKLYQRSIIVIFAIFQLMRNTVCLSMLGKHMKGNLYINAVIAITNISTDLKSGIILVPNIEERNVEL